jgi:energy-coupling factor transporter ATP-binding protein EcfA2
MIAEPPSITVSAPGAEPMKDKTPVIEINHLVRKYGRAEAVNGLSLRVEAGKCHGFFGRNGAGKTTTIKCLLNLLQPTSGLVRVFGMDPRAPGRRRRAFGHVSRRTDCINAVSGVSQPPDGRAGHAAVLDASGDGHFRDCRRRDAGFCGVVPTVGCALIFAARRTILACLRHAALAAIFQKERGGHFTGRTTFVAERTAGF